MNENQECADENECENDADDDEEICANGKCVNRDPGYVCLCNPGYIPSQDQRACLDTRQGSCYAELVSYKSYSIKDNNGTVNWELP